MGSDGARSRTATRRDVLKIAGAVAAGCAAPSFGVAPAQATPAEMQAAVDDLARALAEIDAEETNDA